MINCELKIGTKSLTFDSYITRLLAPRDTVIIIIVLTLYGAWQCSLRFLPPPTIAIRPYNIVIVQNIYHVPTRMKVIQSNLETVQTFDNSKLSVITRSEWSFSWRSRGHPNKTRSFKTCNSKSYRIVGTWIRLLATECSRHNTIIK